MAELSATARVIPADQVKIAAGRFAVPGPAPVENDQARNIIDAAMDHHRGEALPQTTRLLAMHDLLMELGRRGLLERDLTMRLSTAALSYPVTVDLIAVQGGNTQ